jgi:molybdopterin synthase sulfur carrier subunit
VEIRVYATLRDIVGGKSIHLDSAPEMTVEHMLQEILARYPALRTKVFDEEGDLQRAIHVFVNGREVHYLNGLETVVTPEDEVRIFPPVGGGCR